MALTPDDLTRFDQFHLGGVTQTRAMATAIPVMAGDRILDIGCGIGGSARVLAAEFGATVVGVDAVRDFIESAKLLTARSGLAEHVRYFQAAVPPVELPDNPFDIIWVQLVLMNIADKRSLFAECARLLRPGGALATLDVILGPGGGNLYYPVLWADRPERSHLLSLADYHGLLQETGFEIVKDIDYTQTSLAWIDETRRRRATMSEAERSLSTALIISGDAALKSANVRRNLAEGRLGVRQWVARRGR